MAEVHGPYSDNVCSSKTIHMKKLLDLKRNTVIWVAHLGLYDSKDGLIEKVVFNHIQSNVAVCSYEEATLIIDANELVKDLGSIYEQ